MLRAEEVSRSPRQMRGNHKEVRMSLKEPESERSVSLFSAGKKLRQRRVVNLPGSIDTVGHKLLVADTPLPDLLCGAPVQIPLDLPGACLPVRDS